MSGVSLVCPIWSLPCVGQTDIRVALKVIERLKSLNANLVQIHF